MNMKTNKLVPIALLTVAAVGLAGVSLWLGSQPASAQEAGPTPPAATGLEGLEAVLYKSPSCSCCDAYVGYLEQNGVSVTVMSSDAEVARVKRDNQLPPAAWSCHSVELGGYIVEGHVPLEAVELLLAERPDIDGIALPGMPSGSPGMPGPKLAPFQVLQLEAGQLGPFTTL